MGMAELVRSMEESTAETDEGGMDTGRSLLHVGAFCLPEFGGVYGLVRGFYHANPPEA